MEALEIEIFNAEILDVERNPLGAFSADLLGSLRLQPLHATFGSPVLKDFLELCWLTEKEAVLAEVLPMTPFVVAGRAELEETTSVTRVLKHVVDPLGFAFFRDFERLHVIVECTRDDVQGSCSARSVCR